MLSVTRKPRYATTTAQLIQCMKGGLLVVVVLKQGQPEENDDLEGQDLDQDLLERVGHRPKSYYGVGLAVCGTPALRRLTNSLALPGTALGSCRKSASVV